MVGNDDLAAIVETSDEWIRSRTGIVTRRHAGDDDTVPGMATAAALHALTTSGIAPATVDLVVVATTTAEHRMAPLEPVDRRRDTHPRPLWHSRRPAARLHQDRSIPRVSPGEPPRRDLR